MTNGNWKRKLDEARKRNKRTERSRNRHRPGEVVRGNKIITYVHQVRHGKQIHRWLVRCLKCGWVRSIRAESLGKAEGSCEACGKWHLLVYFIEGAGLVKIGLSGDPLRRLRQLQYMSPVPLRLLGTVKGGYPQERKLHIQFWEHHDHGEWFRGVPEILDYINKYARKSL